MAREWGAGGMARGRGAGGGRAGGRGAGGIARPTQGG
jgi:hypothetical protein